MILELKHPIKVILSELYLLIIEDANGVRHYWHNKHTSTIEGKEVNFEEGQYDGHSRELKDCKEP